jgi:hypothetical protein
MRPDELAAHSRKRAAENDDLVLRVLVNAGDDGLRPGRELADRTGLAARTTTDVLGRLIDRGLARRAGKRRAWATTAGRTEIGAGMPGVSLLPALEAALECFPAEALRAFARLQLAAVPARWHLADEYSARWPGFISVGHTKSCKTAVASFVCAVYGLDERSAIRLLREETSGSILGRRRPDRASPSGYRFEHLPILDASYLCLDELDDAPQAVRAAAAALLHGTTQAELEGVVRTIRPVIYTAMNRRDGLLGDAYVRRSVMLDTSPLRHLLIDVDLDMARLFDRSGRIPRLPLERLKPPAAALPPDLRRLLRDELRRGLTEEGWALTDTDPLERIVLGLGALTDGDLEQAVLAVALDALCCASTLGHTVAGYVDRLAPRLGNGALLPDADAVEHQQQQLATLRRDRALEKAIDRDRLVEERGRVAQIFREAIARLDGRGLRDCAWEQRVAARGVADLLRGLLREVTAARSWQAIQAVEERGREPLRRVGELLQQIDQERTRRQQTAARVESLRRSRKPELAPARALADLIRMMLPGAAGEALDVVEGQARQLEVAPPVTEEQRRRDHEQLALKQVQNAQRVDPGWIS